MHCTLRADYAASASDSSVLQRPLKEELLPEDVRNVFDYPRNLKDKCVTVIHILYLDVPYLRSNACVLRTVACLLRLSFHWCLL